MQCPSCNAPAPEGSRFCPACAAPLQEDPTSTSLPTEATPSYTPPSTPGDPPGRFLPGTMIDARYRIGGLLGRGGMGEVYRADDIKLGQPVALKFLPRHMERDEQWLERFLNEVRTARQVTHPNVCRVYDFGEVDGQHFLSMEYVDGEDLASLLRRIGRLPEEKATQIARQLCAGVSASHQEGVLHRDLKPANVMIDGRGRVRITDFGLARWADSVQGHEVLAGTPGYMAPEQIAGQEATARSDIYALGLVLYELYTGKQVYQAKNLAELRRLQEESTPTSMGSLVEHLDPAVEEVVGRCLSKDPASRPSSALNVAAALPGGDPLAAALAAGETPSPELVAAAGDTGSLSGRAGVLTVLAIFLMTAVVAVMQDRFALHGLMMPDVSPPVLENQARELLRELGHAADAGDSTYGLQWNAGYVEEIASAGKTDQVRRAESETPAALEFWYREDPVEMVPWQTSLLGVYRYRVTPADPPVVPGTRNISLGPGGHLIFLAAMGPNTGPAGPADWDAVFAAAGLDAAAVTEAEPVHLSPVPYDTRRAWTGTYPDEPDWPLRIEAASLSGVPVWFQQFGPWDPADPQEAEERQDQFMANARIGSIFFSIIFLGGIGVFLWMARRNLRAGRADRRGTGRLIVFLFGANLLFWLFHSSHVGHVGLDGIQLLGALSWALGRGFFAAVIFLALEPYIRRYWPDRMISWTRLLSGRWRDPLVARDLLVGAAAAAVAGVAATIAFYAGGNRLISNTVPATADVLLSGRYAVANLLGSFNSAVGNSLMMLAFLVLLRVLLRVPWLATAVWIALLTFLQLMRFGGLQLPLVPVALALALTLALVIHRFGLLAYVGMSFWFWVIGGVPLTMEFSAWYATSTILTLGAFVAFVLGAFSAATRGQFSEVSAG